MNLHDDTLLWHRSCMSGTTQRSYNCFPRWSTFILNHLPRLVYFLGGLVQHFATDDPVIRLHFPWPALPDHHTLVLDLICIHIVFVKAQMVVFNIFDSLFSLYHVESWGEAPAAFVRFIILMVGFGMFFLCLVLCFEAHWSLWAAGLLSSIGVNWDVYFKGSLQLDTKAWVFL